MADFFEIQQAAFEALEASRQLIRAAHTDAVNAADATRNKALAEAAAIYDAQYQAAMIDHIVGKEAETKAAIAAANAAVGLGPDGKPIKKVKGR